MRIRISAIVAVGLGLSQPAGLAAQQQVEGVVRSAPAFFDEAQAIVEYWTPERLRSAVPRTPPERLIEHLPISALAEIPAGDPGFVNGWRPGSGPYVEQRQIVPRGTASPQAAPQAFGTAPTNPQSGPYGPFQRWTMHGTYVQWPRSVHGKLFFSLGAGNFVCSATVISRSTIATAGHCLSDGAGTFATNVLFCPSFNQGGINPSRGCWTTVSLTTSSAWHNSGDPDYDYACGVTAVTGTVVADKIGNVTGWAGRAWNWNDQPAMTFGYPQGSPFNGTVIQQTASVEWYNWEFTPGDQASKVIGSDLTGGSSGGGWFLSWRHPATEFPDTDGSTSTDPAFAQAGPHINGVNSHKRCVTNCMSPPNATTGLFWQEMTSPPFRDTAAVGESEDIFGICLGHANNQP